VEPDPRRAVSRAQEISGEHGTVLVTGSIYLVADLLSAPGARRASVL
jgi:dihydrofolate synthase/folylpolyglutamate synthase